MLRVEGLHKAFGGLKVLDGIDLEVGPGQMVGLIGPNGSGKTTLLNVLTGFYTPDAGRVLLDGRLLSGLAPHRIFRLGVVRSFQLTRVFPRMTALENLLVVGASAGLQGRAARRRAEQLLEAVALGPQAHTEAGQLSGGQKKLLEFATCFMAEPVRVVALDEPFAGVHASVKAVMTRFLRQQATTERAVILVTHDMPELRGLCPRTVVMAAGRVVADGPTSGVLEDRAVVEAYLGGLR